MNPFEREHIRASDADRQLAADLVNAAHTDGRLTLPEHADRLSQVWQSTTLGELDGLVADLGGEWPIDSPQFDGSQITAGPDAAFQRCVAIFSTTKREDDWIVPEHLSILGLAGTIVLDLRKARFASYRVRIEVAATLSDVKIYVPDGVWIDDQLSVILGESVRKGVQSVDPEAPALRLDGFLAMSTLTVYGSGHKSWAQKLGLKGD